MIKEAIATGETTQQAFEKACNELGVETTEAQCEIIEIPEKGFLGIFRKKEAKVRAFVEISPAKVAADYLASVIKLMGVDDIEIEINEVDAGAELMLVGNGINNIIGHHGETLDSLQYLTGLVANHIEESYYRVTLNTGNYREKREQTLEILGKKMAQKAVYTNKKYALEAMNPYERRIIHTAVQSVETATSWSEGEDATRHVVIGPADGENARWGIYRPSAPRNNDRKKGYNKNGSFNKGSRPPYNKNRNNNNSFKKNGNSKPYNKQYSKPYSKPYNKPYQKPFDKNVNMATNTQPQQVVNNEVKPIKKSESSAPLYGKIEVPKKD